jgi:hypothetical protein
LTYADFTPCYDLKGREQHEAISERIDTCRLKCSEAILREISEKGLPLKTLSDTMGIDVGGFYRRLHNQFSAPYDSVVILANVFMAKSCHEMLFGEGTPTIMPNFLGYVAWKCAALPASARRSLQAFALQVYANELKNNSLPTGMPAVILMRERIRELAEDDRTTAAEVLGPNVVPFLKSMLKRQDEETLTRQRGSLKTLMCAAVLRKTSVDYFIVRDYTKWTTIAYRPEKEVYPVTDNAIVDVISKYLTVSETGRIRIYGEMVKALSKNEKED